MIKRAVITFCACYIQCIGFIVAITMQHHVISTDYNLKYNICCISTCICW